MLTSDQVKHHPLLCEICHQGARHRSIRINTGTGKYRFEKRPICTRCDAMLRNKPSPSRRGRKRNRHVPAPSTDDWIKALHRSWSITGDCFRCEISGLKLDTKNRHCPLAWTCDHDPPGSGRFLVVAWVINDMKNDHDQEEFIRNVRALVGILVSGKPDPALADAAYNGFSALKHWRRR